MDRSFLRSTPPMIALPAALAAAAAYFFLAPTPPEKPMLGQRGVTSAPAEWVEWRTPEFDAARSSLDRSNPVQVVREVFDAFREKRYEAVLAHCTERLLRRQSPEIMKRRLGEEPGFTGWDRIEIDSVDAHDDRVIVLGRSLTTDRELHFRAILSAEGGGWSLDYLRLTPVREEAESSEHDNDRPRVRPPRAEPAPSNAEGDPAPPGGA
ncbi:MAG: hypothetical protein IBJ10_05930 [Phycisphaerales bacterium]|nr:hypothetical protein [Phycisphaerales bacterium]